MIPDGLKQQLVKHEGLRLKPYHCSAGKLTIGVGHNIDAHPLPYVLSHHLDTFGCITEDMAFELLEDDVAQSVTDCNRLYRDFDKFSERRQWALIDFVFNVGLTTARSFYSTNRAINRGDWQAAAEGLKKSLWYRQVGSRGETITEMVRNG